MDISRDRKRNHDRNEQDFANYIRRRAESDLTVRLGPKKQGAGFCDLLH